MKSFRPIFIISGILTLIGFGVALFFMFFGPDSFQFEGKES